MPQPRKDPGVSAHRALCSLRIRVGGRVQGVGFRPFVYHLARQLDIRGSVANLGGTVQILAHGTEAAVHTFLKQLIDQAPAIARPYILDTQVANFPHHDDFEIVRSTADQSAERHLPPDYFTCDACLVEMADPGDRRYRYPFTNCTQCGPRYTLIRDLPYDRQHTSMAGFGLCPACRAEYDNPADRRFHAEPVACPRCGPQLRYIADTVQFTDTAQALQAAVRALEQGAILAVKGVGGYHLLCDARNEDAVRRLRARKQRPHKPLAVLFPQTGADGLDSVRQYCTMDQAAEQALLDPARPIVLLRRIHVDHGAPLAPSLAPDLDQLGCMLPYSPLHHLLANDLGTPLVATSANVSGEPVLTEEHEIEARLAAVADGFLHHDRPILRPADDSVVRPVAGRVRALRLGRGLAPLEWPLEQPFPAPVLAVGAHTKNTVALGWNRRLVVSPHIGDLDTPRSRGVFAAVIEDLQRLYGVSPRYCVHDTHPDYASTRWALASGLEPVAVPHHRAHAAALAGEFPHEPRWLVFTWDGTGLGEDGSLWGGEALLGRPGAWRRVASLRPFSLPGGDRAARQPWRAAAALAWETGRHADAPALVREAWERNLNCVHSSAAGRLFDAAAAWLGLVREASYEGQGPMYLETIADPDTEAVPLSWTEDPQGIWRCDWAPLLPMLDQPDDAPALRAGRFHASLAEALAALAAHLSTLHGDFAVGLGGGVFQNRVLAERALSELACRGLRAYLPSRIPCNDGGLSFGQLIEARAILAQAPSMGNAP